MKQNESKLVVVTRSDISPGYQVVQSAHSVADFATERPDQFKIWKETSNSIIVLSVPNEGKLIDLSHKLGGILFYEPDINEYTSFGIFGTPDIRKKLRYLPLCLKEKK